MASLEFISRMYGIHITQNKVYWSCLENENQYNYSQTLGDREFKMTTNGDWVVCSINGKELFSFTKGTRIVSDLTGKIIEVVGIETKNQKTAITYSGKTFSLSVAPNTVYSFKGKFQQTKRVGFDNPDK